MPNLTYDYDYTSLDRFLSHGQHIGELSRLLSAALGALLDHLESPELDAGFTRAQLENLDLFIGEIERLAAQR